jgi:DNA-directed RNA polymerase subunit F
MSEFTFVEETPISLVELKDKFKDLKKDGLSFRAEKTQAYLDLFALNSNKEVKELAEKIMNLNIPRLKERHVMKIIDVMPKDIDSLKLLFSAETLTIKDEDLKKILDVIPQ